MEDESKSNIYEFGEIMGYTVKKKTERHNGKCLLFSGVNIVCNLGEMTHGVKLLAMDIMYQC